jgi:hypothetical protein
MATCQTGRAVLPPKLSIAEFFFEEGGFPCLLDKSEFLVNLKAPVYFYLHKRELLSSKF